MIKIDSIGNAFCLSCADEVEGVLVERQENCTNCDKVKKEDGSLAWASANVPVNCDKIEALYSWSSNHEGFAPYCKFLDLIGWSEETVGQPLGNWKGNPADSLGFMELGYLGEALVQYSDHPQDVEAFIQKVWDVETEFGL